MTPKKIIPTILGQAKHEIDKQYLSSEKAKRILGWMPSYNLEEGIKKTIEWYKHHWNIQNE